jgi:hypothetical protein
MSCLQQSGRKEKHPLSVSKFSLGTIRLHRVVDIINFTRKLSRKSSASSHINSLIYAYNHCEIEGNDTTSDGLEVIEQKKQKTNKQPCLIRRNTSIMQELSKRPVLCLGFY